MDADTLKPSLKVVGLHVEEFRALRKLDWPADGLGWGETVPDFVMVGGVNGSGKTTLLELIAEAAKCVFMSPYWTNLEVEDDTFVKFALTKSDWGNNVFEWSNHWRGRQFGLGFEETLQDPVKFAKSNMPSVVYLPSDRKLEFPQESYKVPGKLTADETFFHKFKASTQWRDSLEALLYGARWADLNAKDEGHPERAIHFESYTRAFRAFFGDTKTFVWDKGELFVKIMDTGALHPLIDLSSGEKQALILAAELYRRWRPGSLILIDEPELHFHPSWQTAFYLMLEQWQKERGGQVIIATQSTHLFRIAPVGSAVLLGGPLA